MQPSLKFLLLFSLTISSCATNDQKQEPKSDTVIPSAGTTQNSATNKTQIAAQSTSFGTDTLTVDRRAAVFYQPDSVQSEKRMTQVGESDFRAGMDDYIYYINISAEYLKKQGLPVIDAKNKKYLRFVMADKKTMLIRLDTLQELWGMYLFDPKKKPYYTDIIEIEEEYKNYYK